MVDKDHEGSDLEGLANIPNYYSLVMSWFGPYVRGRGLEYGPRWGTFSQYLRPLAQRLTLIEPSANLHTAFRAKFVDDPPVEIVVMTLE
jgi:hypothetical protein